MGFVKDAALAAVSPLGFALMHKKKKTAPAATQPTMISSAPSTPTSMIGSTRGGY